MSTQTNTYLLRLAIKESATRSRMYREEASRCCKRARKAPGENIINGQIRPSARSTWRDRMGLSREKARGESVGQRHRLLALGFLRGKSYRQIERTCNEMPIHSFILKLVVAHSTMKEREASTAVSLWLQGYSWESIHGDLGYEERIEECERAIKQTQVQIANTTRVLEDATKRAMEISNRVNTYETEIRSLEDRIAQRQDEIQRLKNEGAPSTRKVAP